MIKLTNVCVRFGEKQVLSDFSAAFADAGQYAILGPSGCGKTTLLRIIAGLQAPDSGTVERPNTPVSVCFQEDRLLPWRSVWENIALALPRDIQRDKVKARTVAKDWLTKAHLENEPDALPASLSGGMRRRVALVRALAMDAPVLLLDEPFRALDEENHAAMLELVKKSSANRLLILVTHDESDAAGMQIVRMTPQG